MKRLLEKYRESRRKYSMPRWAVIVLVFFLFCAVFADFIANEKPLYCKYQGRHYFPVVRSYFVQTGMVSWPEPLLNIDWVDAEYETAVRPPVPWSAQSLDLSNAEYKSPFDKQNVRNWRFRHWLGTDKLGRDVLAGMIRGCRIAMFVGVLSMLLASLIGIPAGAAMGYFGDRTKVRWTTALALAIAACLVLYYTIQLVGVLMRGEEPPGLWFLIFIIVCFACFALIALLGKLNINVKRIRLPLDFISMRGIELFKSLPIFFILFTVLGMIRNASIWYVLILIALIRWPTVARYVRAETFRIRDLPYILAARGIGLKNRQIIVRHIIPNALGPVLVTLAFGMGSAVLIESGLSFLGIGIPVEEVSWGKMLNEARKNFSAWWLAIFPGVAIFLLISSFHALGDSLQRYFQPRMREGQT